MGTRGSVREVEIAAVFPVVQAPIVERVEHQLTLEPEQVEHAWSVVGDERTGRGEVLARHDLRGLGRAVLVGRVLTGDLLERRVQVPKLLVRITGLLQFVPAREREGLDAITDARVGVVTQPRGRFHDVRVSVVDDPSAHVGHMASFPQTADGSPSRCRCPRIDGVLHTDLAEAERERHHHGQPDATHERRDEHTGVVQAVSEHQQGGEPDGQCTAGIQGAPGRRTRLVRTEPQQHEAERARWGRANGTATTTNSRGSSRSCG